MSKNISNVIFIKLLMGWNEGHCRGFNRIAEVHKAIANAINN